MATPESYLGSVSLTAGTWAPKTWNYCQGQVTAIVGNQALYAVIGTQYGGDGRSTFGYPDYRGRLALGMGTGPSLTPRYNGNMGGLETVELTIDMLPPHTHVATTVSSVTVQPDFQSTSILNVNSANANSAQPGPDRYLATGFQPPSTIAIYSTAAPDTNLNAATIDTTVTRTVDTAVNVSVTNQNTGTGIKHENMPPFTVAAYIMCFDGLFPARND